MIDINNTYNIYIDIKDTNGTMKISKLQDVLNHTLYDFSSSTVSKIQEVRSDQVNILQLSDILIGAISHNARGLSSSKAKTELISYISEKAQRPLIYSSPKSEIKFNILDGHQEVCIMCECYKAPKITSLSDFNGDYEEYEKAIYNLFSKDFIDNQIFFNGKPVRHKRYPEHKNMSGTF